MRHLQYLFAAALAAALAAPALHAQSGYTARYTGTRPITFPSGTDLRGVDVNTNIGSPYYGYVYICDRGGQSATNQTGRVRIYKPVVTQHRNGATNYEDTGMTVEVISTAAAFTSPFGPLGVSVADDDTIWVVDFGDRQVEWAPHPTSTTPVASTPVINLADYDTQAGPELPTTIPSGAAATWTVGNPRNLTVYGTSDDLTVIVSTNTSDSSHSDQTIQKYTVDVSAATPAVTYNWTRALTDLPNDPNVSDNQNGTGYDVTTDHLGNVYVPLRGLSGSSPTTGTVQGQIVLRKLDPDGNDVAFANTPYAPVSADPTAKDLTFPTIGFVRDPSIAGGGYLYLASRNGTRMVVARYDLEGRLLDAAGPSFNYNVSLGPNNGDVGAAASYAEADDTGNLYVRDSTNFVKVFHTQPFVITGGAIKSSPSTYSNGVTYIGSSDGYLYAIDTATGQAPAGTSFPVDIRTLTGGDILGRVAVRALGPTDPGFIYFTTSNGRLGRLPLSGDAGDPGAWLTPALVTSTTVAVTPAPVEAGYVYVAMGDGASASFFRVDAATGGGLITQTLGAATDVKSSPVVVGNKVYVGTSDGTFRILDDGTSLVVSAKIGASTPGSPFVNLRSPNGPVMYSVDSAGTVHARNADNFQPIAAFDGDNDPLTGPQNGEVSLGTTVESSLYATNSILYVGGMDNKVYAVNEATGTGAGPAGYTFFDAGAGASISEGVAIGLGGPSLSTNDPGGPTVIFGSTNGLYYQVRTGDPSAYRAYVAVPTPNPFDTAPSVDRNTTTPGGTVSTQFIGNDDTRLYRIPRL